MPLATPPATRRLPLTILVVAVVSLLLSAATAVTVFSAPLRTVAVPSQVGFDGYLVDAGTGSPLQGTHDLTFKLYSVATGGSASWTQVHEAVTVTDGLYSVLLDSFPTSTFTGARWLGIQVDTGTEITPRTRIGSVPFALNAQSAEEVAWGGVTGKPSGFSDNIDDVGTGAPGTGAAGRVSVFVSSTNVDGASGLLYANNILTVTGKIHATGAIDQTAGAGARVYNSATLSIPGTNTQTVLTFNSERWDTGGLHSTATNTSRLTAVTPGTYLIVGQVAFAANGTGRRRLSLRLNGATTLARADHTTAGTADTTAVIVTTVYELAAGDYVELEAYQNSGVALNANATGNYSSEFMLVRLP